MTGYRAVADFLRFVLTTNLGRTQATSRHLNEVIATAEATERVLRLMAEYVAHPDMSKLSSIRATLIGLGVKVEGE